MEDLFIETKILNDFEKKIPSKILIMQDYQNDFKCGGYINSL